MLGSSPILSTQVSTFETEEDSPGIDSNRLGQLAQVYVELGGGIFSDESDDAGEVNYSVVDPSTTAFQVQLRVVNNVATSNVYLEGIQTSVNHIGDTISVGFS